MDIGRTEFPAMATTYVGNFRGNCTIQLNGQAIVVIDNGVEINRWPYNCIRQFRAEDESGKFSFVSGRRGPYGVAEYNFQLFNNSLIDLQSVLTEFTGAQFSAVAPGSDTPQQPLQPQQPLPPQPYPPTLPRPTQSTSSNAYTTSMPRHMTMGGAGGRIESSSSFDHYPDSVFGSPAHAQGPRLPPRHPDQLNYSTDETTLRGVAKSRSRAATSGSPANTATFGLDTGTYSAPRPALPPPRREAKEPSPEVLVAKSSSYEEARLPANHHQHQQQQQQQQQAGVGTGGKGVKAEKPTLPKKKSFFERLRGAGNDDSKADTEPPRRKMSGKFSSPQDVHSTDNNGTHDHTNHSKPHSPPPSPPRASKPKPVEVTKGKKESPYDHLPSEREQLETSEHASGARPSSGVSSPVGSEGNQSSDFDGCSDLDYIPRSSPTVPKTRPITPEHAQHLRKLTTREGTRAATTLRGGRRSPPEKLSRKANTLTSIEVRRNGRNFDAANHIQEDESVYNVPRSSSNEESMYKTPKSVLDSPPSPRINGTHQESMYSAPRPVDSSSSSAGGHRGSVNTESSLYNVPSSILARGEGEEGLAHRDEGETTSSRENLYNIPRSCSSDDLLDNAIYNDPRGTFNNGVDTLYHMPRPAHQSSPPDDAPQRAGNYESIDVEVVAPPHNSGSNGSGMRPARSFESLHRARINTPSLDHPRQHHNTLRGNISTPAFSSTSSAGKPAPKCEYVDIDLDANNRPHVLAPAKNAPLPPLPTLAAASGPDHRVVEGVYAEIIEQDIAKNREMAAAAAAAGLSPNSQLSPSNPAYSLYSMPPTGPARPLYPDGSTVMEGIAKAHELAEEGYELFLPAELRQIAAHNGSKSFDASYPPPSSSSTSATALMEKYNINIHESTLRTRPYSESDVLEDGQVGRKSPAAAHQGRTSIPDGGEVLSDEYVIVTGPDRRPKTNFVVGGGAAPTITTSPPPSGSSVAVEDEYEAMNSASLNLSASSSQHPQHHSSTAAYPTNTWMGGVSSVPQPQQSSSSSSSQGGSGSSNGNGFTRQSSSGRVSELQESAGTRGRRLGSGGSTPPLLPPRRFDADVGEGQDESTTAAAGISLEEMSPTAHNSYHSSLLRRQSSNASSSSVHSSEGSGSRADATEKQGAPIPFQPAAMKIMAGSPLDRFTASDLKKRTQSQGNVLDRNTPSPPQNAAASTSTSTSTNSTSSTTHSQHSSTQHFSSPSPPGSGLSLSPPGTKHHQYVNCTPKEGEEEALPSRVRTVSAPKNKPPKALPRSILLRGDSIN